jgi:hypothetical protein
MKTMKQIISELVEINHSNFTFDSDIFNIEIHDRNRLKLYPRDMNSTVFYRIAQVSKILNDADWIWYVSTTRTGAIEITTWK